MHEPKASGALVTSRNLLPAGSHGGVASVSVSTVADTDAGVLGQLALVGINSSTWRNVAFSGFKTLRLGASIGSLVTDKTHLNPLVRCGVSVQ